MSQNVAHSQLVDITACSCSTSGSSQYEISG